VSEESRIAVILAAGKGTRLKTELPKVLHKAAGRPMLAWVVDAARQAGCEKVVVVVSPGSERVQEALYVDGRKPDWLEWAIQEERRGTGHALLMARPAIEGIEGRLLVLAGDAPLVTAETLHGILEAARNSWGAIAVSELKEPGNLGRVIASREGSLARIVEAADAGLDELEVKRVNSGVYVLPLPEIFDELERLTTDNAQGELYLTDAPSAAANRGERVVLYSLEDVTEAWGVNTRSELARAHRRLIDRHQERLLEEGVTLLEPHRTVIEPSVRIGPDAVIHPDVTILGDTEIGDRSVIHSGVWIQDSRIGSGVAVYPQSVLDGAVVPSWTRVGPFARLGTGAVLAASGDDAVLPEEA
jgi:bifunctional UDP-N-acetylglucosamine pyrophosphorylase / glucosamine-1-phosphate N-acetyltransferase